MLILKLPYPPSVNHMYINAHGRRFPNKKALDYKIAVQDYVIEYNVPKLGEARLELTIWVYPPDKRKRDISNIIKIVEDSLQDAGVYENDFQIDVLMVQRGKIIKGGGITVMIETIDNEM
jgi:crossover junction endodeoxyribonuclease RusA